MPKVFVSHTAADKPIVEPIALELRKIFGEDEVFYDAWTIKPGDGIIEKMNEGLNAPEFFFFFVSEKSKASPMVKLEWQNALMQVTKGVTRIIPVRVDGCDLPPILLQNLYIDMHTQGIEATVHQIANLVQGNDGFTSDHGEFSNLTCSITGDANAGFEIVISASHLMEVNPKILFCVGNSQNEFNVTSGAGVDMAGFVENVQFGDGTKTNIAHRAPVGANIAPKKPLRFKMTPVNDASLKLTGIYIENGENTYRKIPVVAPSTK